MIIGLCGKSGSGKSTLSRHILDKYENAIHVDIDKVGHYILTLEEVKKELVNAFGEGILSDNSIDRKKLGKIVFNSKEAMDIHTYITWKYMEKEIDSIIYNNQNKIVILDWLLLPKTKYMEQCDLRILLDIPYEIRKQRAMERDGITEEAFDLRDSNSIAYNKEDFDCVLNDNSKEYVEKKVRIL